MTPNERAERELDDAIDDLNAAICMAKTRQELAEAKAIAEGAIKRLEIAATVAITFDQHLEFVQKPIITSGLHRADHVIGSINL